MKTPLYCLPSTPRVLSVVLFLLLNGWSRHIWCAVLLNDNMDLHMSSLGTLLPEGPWCVFYATRCQVYCGLTHSVVFYWYFNFISHTHTHTHMHTHKYTQCKTRFFLWNTTNTDRNGLNKTHVHTHTHTPKTQRKRTLGQVS